MQLDKITQSVSFQGLRLLFSVVKKYIFLYFIKKSKIKFAFCIFTVIFSIKYFATSYSLYSHIHFELVFLYLFCIYNIQLFIKRCIFFSKK